MWFQSMLRWLLGVIDGWIYTACAWLYDLMMDIASAKVFSNETIQDVSMRVYQLLGLVMLFRLIFAFLTYVINPEDMTDKNKGYTKIIKKVFISLALVIITPWLFTQSRNLQIYIINDHLIEYFIFGTAGSSQARPGYDLMFTVTRVFYAPYACANADCSVSKSKEESKTCLDVGWSDKLPEFEKKDGKFVLKTSEDNIGKCAYGTNTKDYADNFYHLTHVSDDGRYDFSRLKNVAQEYDSSKFKMDLQFPFIGSTLVGGFVFYVLLIMCMDIALRSVKLSFYEMIAPVPILSNLGFKDGKDSMLNKWFHEVLKTYADLFTRVAGLQIAIFAVEQITHNENRGFADGNNGFVTLFLIIGALMFAKKLPDILKGMGINFEGGGSFNIKKKLNDEVAGTKLAKRVGAAGLGFVGGAGANLYKAGSNAYMRKKKLKEEMAKQGMEYNRKNRAEFMSDQRNWKYGNTSERRAFEKRQVKNDTFSQAIASGKSAAEAELISSRAAAKAEKDYKKNHAGEYGGNIIAGAFSAAARAATTKDGKLFAGAAEGVKGAVDARDLNDKRQEAGYDWITRQKDTIRSFAGVDTAAKGRANDLRDEISKLQSDAYAYQQQASASMQEFMNLRHIDASGNVLNFTPKDLQDYIKNPNDFESRGMTMGMTDSELNRLNEAANAYNQATQNYSSTQTKITKTTKKIGLYEKEKK